MITRNMSKMLFRTVYTPIIVISTVSGLRMVDENADQRNRQQEQEDVADVHGVDDAPENVRVVGDQSWPWRDALKHQGAEHDGHGSVGRDAECEQRDEGARGCGIVRRLRPGHTLDGAASKAFRVAGQLLLGGVGHQRGDGGAAAGQDAQDEA
jgi:hypothetical protein